MRIHQGRQPDCADEIGKVSIQRTVKSLMATTSMVN